MTPSTLHKNHSAVCVSLIGIIMALEVLRLDCPRSKGKPFNSGLTCWRAHLFLPPASFTFLGPAQHASGYRRIRLAWVADWPRTTCRTCFTPAQFAIGTRRRPATSPGLETAGEARQVVRACVLVLVSRLTGARQLLSSALGFIYHQEADRYLSDQV